MCQVGAVYADWMDNVNFNPRSCKDCKYFLTGYELGEYGVYSTVYSCNSPANGYSLVTGIAESVRCSDQRATTGLCKPEGALFVPKPAPPMLATVRTDDMTKPLDRVCIRLEELLKQESSELELKQGEHKQKVSLWVKIKATFGA